MKKIVISLAGVLAATAFAPEASAIPAFARQVGMACQACHFQHFPQLNSFGRAFKGSGFTMIGAQPKVEGDHLSIPATLNMSILTTVGYENVSNSGAVMGPPGPLGTPGAPATNSGQFFFPNNGGELSLFVGGRVSENIGFLSELAGAIGASPVKIPMFWDVGGAKMGLVFVASNAPAWSFETLNTGASSTHRMMGNAGPRVGIGAQKAHIAATGAAQYLGTGAGGNGISFVANGEWGFVNIGRYDLSQAINGMMGPSSSNNMKTTYVRGAYTFNAGGWDSAVGIQSFSGQATGVQLAGLAPGVAIQPDAKAFIIDGQMQGEAGGMPLGIYASYGRAQHNATKGNIYNAGGTMAGALGNNANSFNIAGELGVIPHKLTLQLAFRSAKNGTGSLLTAVGQGDKDNAIMLGGSYEVAQNVGLYLTHTSQSGSAWNTPVGGLEPVGKRVTSLTLEANF